MDRHTRTQIIETRKHPAKRDGVDRTYSVYCNGEWREFPVWRVPTEALELNVENKRFAAAKTLVEEELGRPLDPENVPDDEESVIAILLDRAWKVDGDRVRGTPGKDYEALKDDWAVRKQAAPLWIRPDGTVRNGNRRLAMLRRIRQEGGSIAGDWVDAIILPPDVIDETELFRMEQSEQLSQDFKVRYEKIDLLLALREAALHEGIVWSDPQSIDRVAGILKHYAGRDDKRYAAVQLRAIRAIDAYLEYLGHPGEYYLVMQERQVEVFREVGKILQLGDEYPDELVDLTQVAFAAVQSGKNYLELRALRKLFMEDREAFMRASAEVVDKEEQADWPPADPSADTDIESAGTEVLTAEEDEDSPPPPSVAATKYPRTEVSQVLDRYIDTLTASGMNLLTALQQAANRLEKVDSEELEATFAGTNAAYAREALTTIVEWADRNRGYLPGPDGSA